MSGPSSNVYIDEADEVIVVPDARDLRREDHDPDYYLKRLNEIGSPSQRIGQLISSIFNITKESTHEAHFVREVSFVSFIGGLVLGAIFHSRDIQESYIRKHNAEIFHSKYRGNRHFWDTLVAGTFGRGLKYATRTCLLATSASLIGMGSITYRNNLYLPDWIVGMSTLGGLSRLWLGSRAVAVGGLLGASAGFAGYGMAKSYELYTGYPITQWRYIEHTAWQKRTEAVVRNRQAQQEYSHMDYIDRVMKGQD